MRYRRGGETFEARARGEVILSAGAIGSAAILQRSGVGPSEWLAAAGVPVVLDKPGVGRNLQDHLQERAIYKVQRRADAQHHLPLARRSRADGGCSTRCCGAGR